MTQQAIVPVTLTGWRVWDLYSTRELQHPALTRGILIVLDRGGVVMPESDRHVTASELDMILELFSDQALSFHIGTPADENRIPGFLEKLVVRYPKLQGQVMQLNNQLRPNTCEALLDVKEKLGLKLVVHHYSLYGADAWAASVKLADQVLFDAGAGRNLQALNIDDRTMVSLRLVADATKAPISLAGRLTAELVNEQALKINEARAGLARQMGLAGDLPLKADGSADLARIGKFYDACARTLGVD